MKNDIILDFKAELELQELVDNSFSLNEKFGDVKVILEKAVNARGKLRIFVETPTSVDIGLDILRQTEEKAVNAIKHYDGSLEKKKQLTAELKDLFHNQEKYWSTADAIAAAPKGASINHKEIYEVIEIQEAIRVLLKEQEKIWHDASAKASIPKHASVDDIVQIFQSLLDTVNINEEQY